MNATSVLLFKQLAKAIIDYFSAGTKAVQKVRIQFTLLTNSVAPEPKGSSSYSQKPATGNYPEPAGSNLHSPSQSP
jgi:hypothetical protein